MSCERPRAARSVLADDCEHRKSLARHGFDKDSIADFVASLIALMKKGPEEFDPHLPPQSGRLRLKDREDADVLASLLALRADLLVTDTPARSSGLESRRGSSLRSFTSARTARGSSSRIRSTHWRGFGAA